MMIFKHQKMSPKIMFSILNHMNIKKKYKIKNFKNFIKNKIINLNKKMINIINRNNSKPSKQNNK